MSEKLPSGAYDSRVHPDPEAARAYAVDLADGPSKERIFGGRIGEVEVRVASGEAHRFYWIRCHGIWIDPYDAPSYFVRENRDGKARLLFSYETRGWRPVKEDTVGRRVPVSAHDLASALAFLAGEDSPKTRLAEAGRILNFITAPPEAQA